jgi:hypothetical protein
VVIDATTVQEFSITTGDPDLIGEIQFLNESRLRGTPLGFQKNSAWPDCGAPRIFHFRWMTALQ